MSKRRARGNTAAPSSASASPPSRVEAFTFGDPEPLSRTELLDYIQVWDNGRWYDPPVSLVGLANLLRIAPHHSSAIFVKRNLLLASFQPSRVLSAETFSGFALDYLTFGNAYLEKVPALSGRLMALQRSPALHTRRGVEPGRYWFLPQQGIEHAFAPGSIVHLADTDVAQELYGVPEYLSALHSAQLNRSATLFRRRYYDNGSHAGFILYLTDPAQNPDDVTAIREALRQSKGPGNFRNLFMYSPNGKKDGVQLIPISEIAARDDFAAVKNTSRDDMLAAHRVPPQLLGVVPVNAGGFGDAETATRVFTANEIVPLQRRMLGINDMLGVEAIRFSLKNPRSQCHKGSPETRPISL